MKDRDWCAKVEAEITSLKERLGKIEGQRPANCIGKKEVIEADIVWPEMDIDGLHFDAVATHAVFELKEDGKYYSRDILFNSARDTDEGTGRDLLSEYLNSEAVKKTLTEILKSVGLLAAVTDVFLPEDNQGVKKYNGVRWWYWLKPRAAYSSAHFAGITSSGHAGINSASAVGGCAPAFCVA